MSSTTDYQELEALARKGRWLAISTVAGSGAGHVGGPFSAMDIGRALLQRYEDQVRGTNMAGA